MVHGHTGQAETRLLNGVARSLSAGYLTQYEGPAGDVSWS
jgi:hypothetical protein